MDREVKISRLSDGEYQRLFMQLLAGVSESWNQAQVLQHLGNRVDDRFLKAWLREYGKTLRQLLDADHQLASQLIRLNQVGCGELGEIAAEIGRDLLAKPAGNGGQAANLGQDANLPAETSAEPVPTTPVDNAELDEAEAWFNQGHEQWMRGDFLSAAASYDQALQLQPDYHKAWTNRGVALDELGRTEEAIASYDQALQIQRDDYKAWNNRGLALDELGQIEEALTSYDQALQIQPDYHDAWYNRGNALIDLGRLEEAIASYDQALQIQPDDYEAWNNRGNALKSLGRCEEAIASYDPTKLCKSNLTTTKLGTTGAWRRGT